MRIAVIGSGVAGLGAAWALSGVHHVTLFEAAERVGGHSRTLDVDVPEGTIAVDTGFIVFNERNYPNLVALFHELGVETEDSDMSFAVSVDGGSLEYGGRTSAMFATPASLVDRRVWDVVRGIRRFRSEGNAIANGAIPADASIGEYLDDRGYPAGFADHYLLPLASAVWSGTRNNARAIPARTFLDFLDNHGLIGLTDRPQWRTVNGGSRSYVDRVVKEITAVHTGRGVVAVAPTVGGVDVTDVHGTRETFDHVVLATHANDALTLLGPAATSRQQNILGSFRYDLNEVVLHTDIAAMPTKRRVWSSWNAIERSDDDGSRPVAVSYWMNRLQNLSTETDLIVTLNPGGLVHPDRVVDRWVTMHPQFDAATEQAQAAVPTIQGIDGIWFAGAHLGYGFHEDGLQSGLTVSAALGAPAPWVDSVVPRSPASTNALPAQEAVLR